MSKSVKIEKNKISLKLLNPLLRLGHDMFCRLVDVATDPSVLADLIHLVMLWVFVLEVASDVHSHSLEHHFNRPERADTEDGAEPGRWTWNKLIHKAIYNGGLKLILEVPQDHEEGGDLAEDNGYADDVVGMLHL